MRVTLMKASTHKNMMQSIWLLPQIVCLAALPLAGVFPPTTAKSVDVTDPYFGQTPERGLTPPINIVGKGRYWTFLSALAL
jgi:hypothetical protein